MEAPGDEELEWMAMEQLHFQYEVHDELDELEPPLEEPDEPTALNDIESPVKRKKLVFPDAADLNKENEPRNPVPIKRRKLVLFDVDLGATGRSESVEHVSTEETNETSVVEDIVVEESNTRCPRRRAADIAGDCMPITSPSGDRVYAELHRNLFSENVVQARREGQLLSISAEKMIEQIEREQLEQIVAEKVSDGASSVSSLDSSDKLWVDKYAPRSFTELLSDEQINREVLGWLKQWDSCVFGAEKHSTPNEVLLALRKRSQRQSDYSKNKETTLLAADKPLSDDRPLQKALLLCGPPGLGKTTLAHVAARHCGYRVVEINASDDRTSTSLQKKILDAIQMKPFTGDKRPNCLIIDEIDGACTGTEGKSAISFLLELINAEASTKKGEEGVSRQKKRSKVPQLSRPVICICNDLYAPALRPLRQAARIFAFSSPSPHRIVTRLKFICKMEGYKVTDRALTALAVHTESDIRSCLNTLQFLHQKGHRLNPLDLGSQVIGRKDMTNSMFDIWTEVFSKKRLKATATRNQGHAYEEFSRLHELFINHGEHELGVEGIFENFLNTRYHDVYLQKTIKCLDLLTQSDMFGRRAVLHHQFFLNLYRPSINLAIRRLIAQPVRPSSLEWPKSFQRCRQLHAANIENLKSWQNIMTPAVVRSINWFSLVHDILSPLLSILAPNIRPVAFDLLSQQEREDIKHLIDIMIGYGVRYKKANVDQENRNTFEAFSLDPPLFNFISFKKYRHRHPQLSLAIQQILCHEVEMECIKRETAKRSAVINKPLAVKENETISSTSTNSGAVTIIQKETVSVTTKTVRVLKSAKTVVKPASFFDRFRTSKREDTDSETSTAKRDSRPLLFKFHEGFTNAVKKPVLMSDLL